MLLKSVEDVKVRKYHKSVPDRSRLEGNGKILLRQFGKVRKVSQSWRDYGVEVMLISRFGFMWLFPRKLPLFWRKTV